MTEPPSGTPEFLAVGDELRGLRFRDDFVVREIAAPSSLAPDAIAFAGDVRPEDDGESMYGTGRIVILHDESEPDAWGELVCMLAGLPPGSENIAVFGGQRSTRG